MKTSLKYVHQKTWDGQAMLGPQGMRQAIGGAGERGRPEGFLARHPDLGSPGFPGWTGDRAQIVQVRQDWPLSQPYLHPIQGSPSCPSCLR